MSITSKMNSLNKRFKHRNIPLTINHMARWSNFCFTIIKVKSSNCLQIFYKINKQYKYYGTKGERLCLFETVFLDGNINNYQGTHTK